MGKIPNWERWKSEERRRGQIKKAWTHSILRDLYTDAEDEWHVLIIDNRNFAEEDGDVFDKWQVKIQSSTIDSPGSFKSIGFDTLAEAEDFAVKWMRENPLESELGWMTLAGHEDKEYLEEREEYYEGVKTRVKKKNDLWMLQVDTEEFIEEGYRLL